MNREDLLARLEAGEDFDEDASAALVELLDGDPALAADIYGKLAQLRELAPEIDPPALDDAISHDLYGRVLAELATGSGNGAGVSGDAPDPPDASAEAEPLPANAETGRATGEGSEPPPDNPFGWLLSLGFGVMVIGFLAAIETTPVRLLPIDDRAIRAPGGETERPVELVPDEFLPGAEVIVEDLVTAEGVDAMMSPSFEVGGEFLIIWLDPDEAR